jgi:hypothetical protein
MISNQPSKAVEVDTPKYNLLKKIRGSVIIFIERKVANDVKTKVIIEGFGTK